MKSVNRCEGRRAEDSRSLRPPQVAALPPHAPLGSPIGVRSNEVERRKARLRWMNGEGRDRTGDTTVFSRVLYQLSYLAKRPEV